MSAIAAVRRESWIVGGILAAAAVARVIAAAVVPDQSVWLPDVTSYRDSAAQLLQQWRISNPYQMPLYPLLIALAGAGYGQAALDIALSVLTVWLVYALARELFNDRSAAIIAGVAAACYPPLIFYAVAGLSETLFVTLVLAAFLFWYRAQFVPAAFAAVLAVMTRPVFDVAAPLLVLFFAMVIHRRSLAQAARQLAVYALIYVALLGPWWLHNYRAYGTFVHLTAGFGTQLYAGNNPLNQSGSSNIHVDFDPKPFQSIGNPIERDRAMRDAAVGYIAGHPGRFVELAGIKFLHFWRLWPLHPAYADPATVIVSVAALAPVLLLAAVGIFQARHELRRISPVLLFGLGYTAIHLVMPATIRYRLPLEPFLIVFAAYAVSRLFRLESTRGAGQAIPSSVSGGLMRPCQ